MTRLKTYRAKRDFARTPEPSGEKLPEEPGASFVVQKHDARRLHYDFRLELDGVLLSWAVPKGPSLDPATKRLAMRTEDHPLDYGGFEGVIPEGEYGAGPVLVWDRGSWLPEADPHEGLRKGHLVFRLSGEKLRGRFHLVRTRGYPRGDRESWLLIKGHDEEASTTREEIVEEEPLSVISGRTIEDIAEGRKAPRRRSRPMSPRVTRRGRKVNEAVTKRSRASEEGKRGG